MNKPNWSGETCFGDVCMAFRGRAAGNRKHEHAALQLCFAGTKSITLRDERNQRLEADALLVQAGIAHSLEPNERLTLVFVEPQSSLADVLVRSTDGNEIGTVSEKLIDGFPVDQPLEALVSHLVSLAVPSAKRIDSRLADALQSLSTAPLGNAISQAAAHVSLSQSRLRAIAHKELGVPLSKWLIWRAIRRASVALAGGASLTEAAFEGGFSDQAHFTRSMVKLLGITPGEAQRPLM